MTHTVTVGDRKITYRANTEKGKEYKSQDKARRHSSRFGFNRCYK